MGKPGKHAIRSVALALSVLVGFAMPLGDSALAVADPVVTAPLSMANDGSVVSPSDEPATGTGGTSDPEPSPSPDTGLEVDPEVSPDDAEAEFDGDLGAEQSQSDLLDENAELEAESPPVVARVAPGSDYCTAPAMLNSDRYVNAFSFTGTGHTQTGRFASPISGTLNGLATAPDGSAVYAASWGSSTYRIQRMGADEDNGSIIVTETVTSGNNGAPPVVGAIDPTGTYYYFGHFTPSPGSNINVQNYLQLFAVNIRTNQWIGRVGQVTLGQFNGNTGTREGDIAFNSNGDMWIVWSRGTSTTASRLFSIDAVNLPVVEGSGNISTTTRGGLTGTSGWVWNGLAFNDAGQLWAMRSNGTTSAYQQAVTTNSGTVNALTGSATTVSPNFAANDISSCGPNLPQVSLTTNVASRFIPTDEFGVSIRRGDEVLVSAATSGGAPSAQTSTMRVSKPTTNFTLVQTPTMSTLPSDYTTTYGCVWQSDGSEAVAPGTTLPFISGDNVWRVALPNVTGTSRDQDTLDCAITNTARPDSEVLPKIVVKKAMNGSRLANTDQFEMQVLRQDQTVPLETSVTAGSGAIVTPGTGQTEPVLAQPGYGYVIGEAAAGSTVLTDYTTDYQCVWSGDSALFARGALTVGSNGQMQSVLPIIPRERSGQTLTCTITNKVKPASAMVCEATLYAVNTSDGNVHAYNTTGTRGSLKFTAPTDTRNGLAINRDGTEAFVYGSNGTHPRITRWTPAGGVQQVNSGNVLSVAAGHTLGTTVDSNRAIAGAVDPVTGYFYFGGYTAGATPRLELFVYPGTGTQYWQAARIDVPGGDNRTTNNGDLTFDSDGNLYFVWSPTGATSQTVLASLDSSLVPRTMPASPSSISSAVRLSRLSGQSAPYNGIAFDSEGRLFATYDGGYVGMNPATGAVLGGPWTTNATNLVDMASCALPPKMVLQKRVLSRGGDSHQFALSIHGDTVATSPVMAGATTSGHTTGLQVERAGSTAVTAGHAYTIRETPVGFSGFGAPFNYTTSYSCAWADSPTTVFASGSLSTVSGMSYRQATLPVIPDDRGGQQLVCTIENSVLKVSKTATELNSSTPVANGTAIDAEGTLQYALRFDNSTGQGTVAVQFSDHLYDVLDDAYLVDASGNELVGDAAIQSYLNANTVNISGVTPVVWVPANKRIDIVGTIAPGAIGTVTIRMKARTNQYDFVNREGSAASSENPLDGYRLRNYLTPRSEDPPATCVVTPGVDPLCTDHPIRSWKMAKGSLPANTARLHAGGNTHYRVSATKLNSATSLGGLVLTDDLTQVFKTAGWAPDAAVPAGALGHGVYLFNQAGNPINLAGTVVGVPVSVQDVTTPVKDGSGHWIVTSGAPLTLPSNTWRVEMWFAVQAGERPAFNDGVTNYPNGLPWNYSGTPANPWAGENAPGTGDRFVNYATGAATLSPNSCITGAAPLPDVSIAPDAVPSPVADPNFPAQCQVQHELSANYFTIRKDAGGVGVAPYADDTAWDPDPTGLWNMVGHEFEVRDNLAGNTMSTYPSKYFCRADYDPRTPQNWDDVNEEWILGQPSGWNGQFTSTSMTGDWGEDSEILAILKSWNSVHPDPGEQLPLCATIYPIAPPSGQEGRWRSENLPAGDFWLLETKAPGFQANTSASATRPIPGMQLLAQPVAFRVWPDADDPIPGEPQSHHGRGQLDVSPSGQFNDFINRCEPGNRDPITGDFYPGGTIAERPTACVNPTGYLMLVKDVAPAPLPLTGGQWLVILTTGGAVVLVLALAGVWWWRRRQTTAPAEPPASGGESS